MKLSFSALSIFLALATSVEGQSVKPNIRGELLRQWDRQLHGKTESMLQTNENFEAETLWTVGETSKSGYTPPGIFDGMGAFKLDEKTIRLLVNHELRNNYGYEYTLSNGLTAQGARVSYFDIDRKGMTIKDAGLAYHTIRDVDGVVADERSDVFLNGFAGYSRFCSGRLVTPGQFSSGLFSSGSGVVDLIYFAPEEDGGSFNPHAGHVQALDVYGQTMWDVAALGRGAWENIAPVDTGNPNTVGFILADDTSPFDADGDGDREAAPLYLYIGTKNSSGDFLDRNGLREGQLYVLVLNSGDRTPGEFRGAGNTGAAQWVAINNTRNLSQSSSDGSTGYDPFGYPTQRNLWLQAAAVGAFGFSRPEDVHENPMHPSTVVLASTGVDTYDINPVNGNGFDSFGTLYAITTDFENFPNVELKVLYDGNQDKTRTIRSPDNLVWSKAGMLCVQEDKAEDDTASQDEVLFNGPGVAVNPNEAGIVCFDVDSNSNVAVPGSFERIANVDRSIVRDLSIDDPETAFDKNLHRGGAWESSGIIDVSELFDEEPGTVFIVNVQAHGIDDQESVNVDSRISDGDLVEGGQLILLTKKD
ncbi:hypothetical protein ACHAXS_006982 [Conticribra weissflogii]